ncbi:hypothetical protein CLF_107683 [Clonorchis sinensis]|uniref:Uncharacterized protein n=1 Tax=Clonorchis sinensis TaxID=79923 RepID=G7YH16_CLOSI|nr:hypothetical protein CLF_107683 [Clonorchis sinensis]
MFVGGLAKTGVGRRLDWDRMKFYLRISKTFSTECMCPKNKTVANEQNSVPLSKLLSTKVSSASMYLRGPHPQMKKEPIHCTQLNFTPTPGVSSLISRINSDWKSPRTGSNKREPSSPVTTGSTAETVFSDDPKHYLNELDSVIKELCFADQTMAGRMLARLCGCGRPCLRDSDWRCDHADIMTEQVRASPVDRTRVRLHGCRYILAGRVHVVQESQWKGAVRKKNRLRDDFLTVMTYYTYNGIRNRMKIYEALPYSMSP